MTANHHTPIQSSPPQPANADTINAPLAELDAAITDHEARIVDLEGDVPEPSGNPIEYLNGEGNYTVPAGTGASVDGHVIKDEGISLPQRASIDFVGAGVTVTNEAGGTQVSIPGGATDHGALTGLSDDDHPQYHNDARGDARYPRKYTGKTAAPTVTDDSGDGYAVSDRWLDETNNKEYVCLDATLGAAVWIETTVVDAGVKPNLMINGGLDFAQRQDPATLTTIAADKYGPDRLRITRENADVQYRRVSAIGETGLTSMYYGELKKITNSGKIHACQPIESINSVPLRGKSVTFQLKLKASASKNIRIGVLELQNAGAVDVIPATLVTAFGANGVDPTLGANVAVISAAVTCAVTTSWQLFSVTVTVPSNSKNIIPAFWTDNQFAANDTLSFAELDFHAGTTTQDWLPRLIADETILVRRYYFKTFSMDVAPAQNAGTIGVYRFIAGKAGGTTQYTSFRITPMRATPTVTLFNPSAANAQVRDAAAAVDCSTSTPHGGINSLDSISIYCTGHASTTVGNPLEVHVTADAEM